MLFEQRLAIDSGHHQGQVVHGLVQAQGFVIGPGVVSFTEAGHLTGFLGGDEADVPGLVGGLDDLEKPAQGESRPGNIHGPGFHATEAVDSLFLLESEQIVQIKGAGLVTLAAHLHLPGLHFKVAGIFPDRTTAIGKKLVEIVMGRRHQAVGQLEIGGIETGVPLGREHLRAFKGNRQGAAFGNRWRLGAPQGGKQASACTCQQGRLQEAAAIQKHRLLGRLQTRKLKGLSHCPTSPGSP